MKKLKTILQYNYFYYLLFIFSIIYVLVNIYLINSKSIYTVNTKNIKGYVTNYQIYKDKITIYLNAKEKILVNYYFKNDKDKINISYGDYIYVVGKTSIPKGNTNFNLFNYKKYLKSKNINYIMNADNIDIKSKNKNIFYLIKNYISNKIEKYKTKSYLKAFILGDKTQIDNNTFLLYQKIGVNHLFSISGMHVSFLCLILFKLFKKINNKAKYIIIILFLIFYMFLVNFTISIIRSVLQFILFSINKLFNLNIKNINLVLLIISLLLIYNPFYIYDTSFLFSFSISFSLIFINKYLKNINNYLLKLLIISTISFLVSFPILVNNFYEINILCIIYNILYIPFVTFLLFLLNVLTLIFPFLDNINYLIINIFEYITYFLEKIKILRFPVSKMSTILVIIYYIFILIIMYKIKNNINYKKYIVPFILLIVFIINNNQIVLTPNITYIDVSQGDCSLIRINNKNILIDTGGNIKNKDYNITDSIILPYIKSIGVKKLDYLILTHGDFDHMGEAINLVNSFKVKKVIFNCDKYNKLEKKLIKVLDKKKIPYYSCIKELNIDNNKLLFLNTKNYDNENDNSNVIYTKINNHIFLFMADAGIEKENDILKKYNLNDISVLKVGHHGSITSSSKKFINSINPKYSVISVGKNNIYGHPNKDVLENLKSSKIYRTDKNGSIMFKIKNNRLYIKTCIP